MATLQIRDLPEHIHRELARQAELDRRSLAQQAIVALAKGLAANLDAKEGRRALLAEIRRTVDPKRTRHLRSPAVLVREDRDR